MDYFGEFNGGGHEYCCLCGMGLEDERPFSALGEDWEDM